MILSSDEADGRLSQLGLARDDSLADAAPGHRVWRTDSLDRFSGLRETLLGYENVRELIRERDDILKHCHYLAVIETPRDTGAPAFWVSVSLSPAEPKVLVWDSADLLMLGSYQSVYGIRRSTLEHVFTVATPEGGSIDQLLLCCTAGAGEVMLAVSDTAVRAIRPTGEVLWLHDSDEIILIASVVGDRIVCEPRVRAGEHDRRTWLLSANTGKLIEGSAGKGKRGKKGSERFVGAIV